MSAAARTVNLKVISDSICPWCLIGTMELRKALARAKENALPLKINIEYRPYQLDPTLPETTTVDRRERYVKKFGDRIQSIHDNLAERARPLGLNLKFGGVIRQTTPSHRLLLKAYETGGQDAQQAILTELLKGYHEREEDIGDPEVLAGYAEKTGVMSRTETLEFLATDEMKKEVADGIQEAREMGVTGVPFTVINNKWAISGGQPSEVFYQVFEKLANEQTL
ncbi:DSBA-like thioredoxin domain protein [Ceratobasidium sp. AG-Ba]|nr:DSBA-like thioredoxin domain protein [Ceratobasidium sp. AG-Ba]